jgi:2-dehydropantoate 2-reductase
MSKTLAVLGTGAIGSSIGADLARAGYNVILIDQWPAHVEAMKANGLHITMPEEEIHTAVQAFHICELSSIKPQLDIVFLASKSYDTCWMVQLIKPYLKPEGLLVSVQNSLNNEWISPIIGYERNIGCAFELSAEVFQPGRVNRKTGHAHTGFILGELHGRITHRLEEVAKILCAAGKTETTTNIWGAKWTKLVWNSMSSIEAIAGIPTAELIENPKCLKLCIDIGKEGWKVGAALGYRLEPIFGLSREDFSQPPEKVLEGLFRNFFSVVRVKRPGQALQDVLKGRRTELEDLNGLVVRKGREANVPTPLNEAVTSLIQQIQQGRLKPDPFNLKLLKQSLRP